MDVVTRLEKENSEKQAGGESYWLLLWECAVVLTENDRRSSD